jgi:hypothetical protein
LETKFLITSWRKASKGEAQERRELKDAPEVFEELKPSKG